MRAPRGRKALLALAVIGLVVAGAGYYALGTPYWSLFLLGRAIERGDAETMLRFIDVDRLAESAFDAQVEHLAASPGDNAWQRMQSDVQSRMFRLNEPVFREFMGEMVRSGLARAASAPPAAGSGGWGLKGIRYSGDIAHVELERETDEQVVGFDMRQQPDRTWKIVRADLQQMAALMD